MFVRLDERVFVEQYHYGIPKAQVGSPFTKCLGKAVPVIEAASESELGHVMRDTFNYLWSWSEGRQLIRGGTRVLEESLAHEQWLSDFETLEKQEQKALQLTAPVTAVAPGVDQGTAV